MLLVRQCQNPLPHKPHTRRQVKVDYEPWKVPATCPGVKEDD